MRLLIDEHGLDWERKLGDHHAGVRVHQSHVAAGSARDLAGRADRAAAAAASARSSISINRDFLQGLAEHRPGDRDRRSGACRSSTEGGERRVRMAHLAVIGSHHVNGVAQLHTELMRKSVFRGFAELYPDRFVNVTNGIAVRRWLKQSNPGLSALLTQRLGLRLGERSRGTRAARRARPTSRSSAAIFAASSAPTSSGSRSEVHAAHRRGDRTSIRCSTCR